MRFKNILIKWCFWVWAGVSFPPNSVWQKKNLPNFHQRDRLSTFKSSASFMRLARRFWHLIQTNSSSQAWMTLKSFFMCHILKYVTKNSNLAFQNLFLIHNIFKFLSFINLIFVNKPQTSESLVSWRDLGLSSLVRM